MYVKRYATAALPRYTSYPPANRFEHNIGDDVYACWLSAIEPTDTLSLYVHIPFCSQLCWYCGCHTSVPNDMTRVDRYMARLMSEIAMVSARVPKGAQVASVHLGGGTPTLLEPTALSRLLSTLRTEFTIGETAEVAVEIDPRGLDPERVAALADGGVTRASIGVQDIDPEVQRLINRVQPLSTVARAVRILRDGGICRINADMMYGLPGQTSEHVRRTATGVSDLDVDRVAVFGYAHVPWFKKHQAAIDAARLPGSESRFEQSIVAQEVLVRNGYAPIGIDHYAKADAPLAIAGREGRLRRNFQGYTDDPASVQLGFGASAIGVLPDGYVQNTPAVKQWSDLIDADRLTVVRGIRVGVEGRVRRAAIERMMCDGVVDLGELAAADDIAPELMVDAFERLAPLQMDGLVEVDGWRVVASPLGRHYLRNIAACFDADLAVTSGKHSQAV